MREQRRRHLTPAELRAALGHTRRALRTLDRLIGVAQECDSALLATAVAASLEVHGRRFLGLADEQRAAQADATGMEAEVRFDLAHVPVAVPDRGGDLLAGGPLWWEDGQADARQAWFWNTLTPTTEGGGQ